MTVGGVGVSEGVAVSDGVGVVSLTEREQAVRVRIRRRVRRSFFMKANCINKGQAEACGTLATWQVLGRQFKGAS